MRSVHLERDFKDPNSSLGYILTPVAQQAFERITAGFQTNSTSAPGASPATTVPARLISAWRWPVLRKAQERTSKRPSALHWPENIRRGLATGDDEPLGVTVLRALGVKWDARRNRPDTEEVLQAVRECVGIAKCHRHAGLLLILDELGKNLEHAARNPESEDVFLLQRLAEEAARSGDNAFTIIATLHQGVAAYAAGLDSAARREWDKVAGRFEEIVYAQPIEQVTALVAATLNVETNRLPDTFGTESNAAMTTRAQDRNLWSELPPLRSPSLGPKIFPLHPTTLPVLVARCASLVRTSGRCSASLRRLSRWRFSSTLRSPPRAQDTIEFITSSILSG